MARIEKTVFISYRRTDVYTALAVYENLKNQGYDVFFDYRSISSGDFEQIITSNIRARAHFLLILTPTALDRCNEPGDWLRREIEVAIDEKRNIVPLFFRGFRFGDPSVTQKLTGKLKTLSRYNGLNVHEDYFDEAMQRLRTQFLNILLDTVIHPVSTEIQNAVREDQVAADKALEQLEKLQTQASQFELTGDLWKALQTYNKIKVLDPLYPHLEIKIKELERELHRKPVFVPEVTGDKPKRFNRQVFVMLIGGFVTAIIFIVIGIFTYPTIFSTIFARPTPTLGVRSKMISDKDGMSLMYIPAGEFLMGAKAKDILVECQRFASDCQLDWFNNEEPRHSIYLNAFWIDQTEVTNKMYALCVSVGACDEPTSIRSHTQANYYGNPIYDNYPVIFIDWSMAKTYCEWAGRRLPTEAEWEKAARGTNGNIYPWGNTFDGTVANFCDKNCPFGWANKSFNDGYGDVAPVGNYPAGQSIYGVFDLAGNVWEWVSSLYRLYPYSATDGREDLSAFGERVLRGGSWGYDHGIIIFNVPSTYRGWGEPTEAYDYAGFRCAMNATH